ncbi:uncharacterized protein F5891DRAFT_1174221 [Suillus fuscotomentosus]|uniref:Uncharacterized protein n=1 Tax=Suillus fuscotomentosus TaxID=1912939 RepID=A0AAD4HJ13_9AGAM|nr:uncharacterized protein F5891DRAFT_1174221 [Suillus fuscotomentosus]KAG1898317.1 hypothetical protein F5891DRAFT_1174221 [Suillus fuscotomentosus]
MARLARMDIALGYIANNTLTAVALDLSSSLSADSSSFGWLSGNLPCSFIAANYALSGHLAGEIDCDRHVSLSAIGASLTTSKVQSLASTELHVCTEEQDVWVQDSKQPWYSDWRTLAAALAICSVYCVVEASQGFRGNLSTSEIAFYLGDTIPVCLAIFVYIPFWPGRFIKNSSHPSSSSARKQYSSSSQPQQDCYLTWPPGDFPIMVTQRHLMHGGDSARNDQHYAQKYNFLDVPI